MPYIRNEDEAQTRSERHDIDKKNPGRMKWMVITALVLSSASLVISALAANTVLGGRSANYGSASVNMPQFIAPSKAVTTEAEPKTAPSAASQPAPDNSANVPAAKPAEAKAQKVIYLTFDDGPGKYTEQIVNILNKKGIHATFFMIGNQLKGNEQAIITALDAGNYVGMHSMSHDKKKLYKTGNSDAFLKEFKQEQSLLEKITGVTPWLIRAPYGSKPEIDADFYDDIAAENFKMWDWTVDSKDWNYPGKPERIVQEIKRQVHRDVEVILMHEKAQTVQALPQIIEWLEKKGYAFAVYKPDQHFPVNFGKDERL